MLGFLFNSAELHTRQQNTQLFQDIDSLEMPDNNLELVNHAQQIELMLLSMIKQEKKVTLFTPGLSELATQIVEIDLYAQYFLIKQVAHEPDHQALLESGTFTLIIEQDSSPIIFTSEFIGIAHVQNIPCYKIAMPPWILRVQTRKSIRVCLSGILKPRMQLSSALTGEVLNISEEGIGLSIPAPESQKYEIGTKICGASLQANCEISFIADLTVCQMRPLPGGSVYLGCSMGIYPTSANAQLRRLILSQQGVIQKRI